MPLIYGSHSKVLDHGRAWLDTMQAARRSATLYVIDGQQPCHSTGQEAFGPISLPAGSTTFRAALFDYDPSDRHASTSTSWPYAAACPTTRRSSRDAIGCPITRLG